jgi:hypothetical protein
VQGFIAQVKRLPGGFKRLFLDVVQSIKLKSANKRAGNGARLTRREKELIRTSFGAAGQMGAFFVLQLPPVIGFLPVSVSHSQKFTFPDFTRL